MRRERDSSSSDDDSRPVNEPKRPKTQSKRSPDTPMSPGRCVEGTSYTPHQRQSELLKRIHNEQMRTGQVETKYDYDLKLVQNDIRAGRNRQSYTVCSNPVQPSLPTSTFGATDRNQNVKTYEKNEVIETINDNYKVKNLLDNGDFGDYYNATNNAGIDLSLKVFRNQYPNDDDQEIEVFRKIGESPHENLITLLASDLLKQPQRGLTGVVIAVSGTLFNIRSVLETARRARPDKTSVFVPTSIKSIGRQVVRGMLHLEQLEVYHLNICPDNIYFAENHRFRQVPIGDQFLSIEMTNDRIKIGDYEFCRFHTQPNVVDNEDLDVPYAYGPPELLFRAPYCIKTDVWAVTTVFAQMYKHMHPFLARTTNPEKSRDHDRCEAIFNVLNADPAVCVYWNDQYGDLGRRLVNIEQLFEETKFWIRAPEKINDGWIRADEDKGFLKFLLWAFIIQPELRPSFAEMLQHGFFSDI